MSAGRRLSFPVFHGILRGVHRRELGFEGSEVFRAHPVEAAQELVRLRIGGDGPGHGTGPVVELLIEHPALFHRQAAFFDQFPDEGLGFFGGNGRRTHSGQE